MRKWYPAALIAAALLFSALLYPHLPERIPTHWNIAGEPNGWSSRAVGAFLLPSVLIVVWGLLRWLPTIDPRRANYEKFQGTYDLAVNTILTFLVAIHAIVLAKGAGWPVPVTRLVAIGGGGLLLVLGNALPRARSNWWFGVRTPWTLSSEGVWARTHRAAGYLLTAAGLVSIGAVLLPARWTVGVLAGSVGVASLASVVYSYVAWKQEQR